MTAHEAKALTLEVWQYLAEYPEIGYKIDLPDNLLVKVKKLAFSCPLCELYHAWRAVCPGCPLKSCNEGSLYYEWSHCLNIPGRKIAAQAIVDTIKAWEPEEE
jgi:hypothetical protein